jgi:antitoxin CptB
VAASRPNFIATAADIAAAPLYITHRPARPGFWRWEFAAMTGMTRSSEGLDERRRRLLYRSWHRGMREMDLIMGRFADVSLADMSDAELHEFEQLSDAPDPDIYNWVCGAEPVPSEFDTGLFRRLRAFHDGGKR